MKDLKESKFFIAGKPVSRLRRMTRSRARRAALTTVPLGKTETSELLAQIEIEEKATFREVLSAAIGLRTVGENKYETDAEACIDLVEKWSTDTSGYDEKNWPEISEALEKNRRVDGGCP